MVTMVNGQSCLMSFEVKYHSTSSKYFATDTTPKFLTKAALCPGAPTSSASLAKYTPTTGGTATTVPSQKTAPPSQVMFDSYTLCDFCETYGASYVGGFPPYISVPRLFHGLMPD